MTRQHDPELGNIFKSLARLGKKIIKSPVTKVLFPAAAAANSKQGLAIAGKLPGGDKLVTLGKAGTGALDKAAKGKAKAKGKSKAKPQAAKKPSAAAKKVAAAKKKEADEDVEPQKGTAVAAASESPAAASGQASVVVQAAPLDVGAIVRQFQATVSPHLNQIAGTLQKLNLQAAITSEHNTRVRDAAFRGSVLRKLGVAPVQNPTPTNKQWVTIGLGGALALYLFTRGA